MITVFQSSLNALGGSTRFTLDLIHMLKDKQIPTATLTISPTNWKKLEYYLTPPVDRPDKEIYIIPQNIPLFTIYQRLLLRYLIKSHKFENNILVNSCGTFQPMFKEDIIYTHGVESKKLSKSTYSTKLRQVYAIPYMLLTEKKMKRISEKTQIIANSKYTSYQLKQIEGIDADAIIYPPVASHIYSPLSRHEKTDNVILIARLAHIKKMDFVIKIAKKRPETKFTVVCLVSKGYMPLLRELLDNCKDLKNVEFHYNINYMKRLSLLATSKIVLNMGVETFGIALAEAVSAGCIPIIYPEGGALEVVEGIEHHKATNVFEASEAITDALSHWTPEKSHAVAEMMHKRFGYEKFIREFMSIVEKIQKQ